MIDSRVDRLGRLGRLAVLALVAAALAPASARAQFATTNVQIMHGWGFRDGLLGSDTANEQLTTLTLNHFSTWRYGDNFAFVDVFRGDFENPAHRESTVYAEWHPRLFVNRLLGTRGKVLGIFRDFGPAFELNQGPDFYAYLAGLGGDLALPVPGVVGLNLYFRYDSVQIPGPDLRNETWQASPYWTIPFALGRLPFLFTGFVDVMGAPERRDVDVLAQPQLLVDLLAPFGGPKGALWAGVEWYLHYNELLRPDTLVSAPQAMLQWNLH